MPELMQTADPALIDPRGAILLRLFELLDQAQVPYCVLHGHATYPAQVSSDVDLLVAKSAVPAKLARLLLDSRDKLQADVVLWLEGRTHYVVLAGRGEHGAPAILQLHISTDYAMDGRVLYAGEDILRSRRQHDSFWIPAAGVEFGCVLANRVLKQNFRGDHERRLSELVEEDPAGCEQNIARFFSPDSVRSVLDSARQNDWSWVKQSLSHLRSELVTSRAPRDRRSASHLVARLRRWLKPSCGLHVVFLGPDGVGKSSVIEAVRDHLRPIFLHDKYLTFAPGLLPRRFETPKPGGPHSLPPRSYSASLLKAAWWALCYTLGYLTTIYPTRARAGWVVNHRYLLDAIVDQKRYRYSGPVWPLKVLWKIAPKPDLLFLLDAPAEVIQSRKKEVAPEETRRQRDAYRRIVEGLPFARIIDASRPLDAVVRDVEGAVLQFLAQRTREQKMGERG